MMNGMGVPETPPPSSAEAESELKPTVEPAVVSNGQHDSDMSDKAVSTSSSSLESKPETEQKPEVMSKLEEEKSESACQVAKEPDDEERKLFVGGLSWDTTEQDLRDYFGTFGTVICTSIKYDAMSGNPRGFGFITFEHERSVDDVLKRCQHVIKDKVVDPKRAKSRPICKKIFVGGIDANMPEEEIRTYFGKYGKVFGIELPRDRQRNRRREFCFIIFETEEAADAAAKQSKQLIGNKECDIKKAQPQPVAQQQKRLAQTAGLDVNGANLGKMISRARLIPTIATTFGPQLNATLAPDTSLAWNGLGYYCIPSIGAHYAPTLAPTNPAISVPNTAAMMAAAAAAAAAYPTATALYPNPLVPTVVAGTPPVSAHSAIDPQAAAAAAANAYAAALAPYGLSVPSGANTASGSFLQKFYTTAPTSEVNNNSPAVVATASTPIGEVALPAKVPAIPATPNGTPSLALGKLNQTLSQ